jgi:hypothetical protein
MIAERGRGIRRSCEARGMTTTTANTARLLVNFAANFRGIQLSKAFFGTNFGISDHASIVETTKAYLDMGGLLAYRPGAGVFFPDEEDRGYIVIRSGDRFETQAATLDDQEVMGESSVFRPGSRASTAK